MMLYKLWFCALLSLALGFNRPKNQEIFTLSPEFMKNVEKFSTPCLEKTNADPDSVRKLLNGTLPNEDKTKNFLYCFGLTGKFTDEEGHFNIDRMSAILGNHHLKEPFQEAMAECNKITKENNLETIYEMHLCYQEKSPVLLTFT